MSNDSDQEWMRELKDGDDLALNRIMERWSRPLESFIYRYVQNHEDAVDLVQETFVRVYLNRERYRPNGKFSTWLFTIALNLCRNKARWRKRHPTVSIDSASPGEDIPQLDPEERNVAAPDAALDRDDDARRVREAIAELPHELKSVILLFQYEGMSYQEIAEILNCSPKAVETRIYRARKKLKTKLAPLWTLSRG